VRILVVNDQAGDVDVSGADTSTVKVTDRVTSRHSAPSTTHRMSADALTLNSSCAGLQTCTVSYNIVVPQATAVRIHADAGTIRANSLSGPVTARTRAGDIVLASVSGPIYATDNAGSILGRDLLAPRAELRLSAGVISATFGIAPAAITAVTAVGSIILRVPGDVRYDVRADATVGSTRVVVERDPKSPHGIAVTTQT
jgi:Putative adhesin